MFVAARQGTIPDMRYYVSTLANDLTVLRVAMPGVKSVTALALVNTGRRYEEEKFAGISHFLEHMVFKGTDKFPTAQDVAAAIDDVGGEFNAFTGKEYTGYYVKLAARYLDTALDVVTDMLCVPTLRQEDIDRESGVIVEEINMYEDMPMRQIHSIFDKQIFADTNLEGEILGLKETVTALKSADFRHYMNEWYGFGNVVFIVAGDESVVGDDSVVTKIENLVKKGGEERKSSDHKPFYGSKYAPKRKQIVYKKTEQAHFKMGFPAFSRSDERRYALTVLTTLMGTTMSSRLFTEIREKRGLCYFVKADTDFYQDVGVFTGYAGVDPKRVNEAVSTMKSEFLALLNEKPVTEQEVASAKRNVIGQLFLELEDSQSVAIWYGMKQLLQGEIETEEEIVKRIEAVTLEDVQKLVHEIVREDNLHFALIGPFKEEDITGIE